MPEDVWAAWLDRVVEETASLDRRLRILRSQMRDRVLHKAGLARGHKVVDLGCGLGFITLEAARLVGEEGRVWGVDSSAGALRILRSRAEKLGLSNVHPLQADAASLPLTEEVDAVVGRSVLSYVPDRKAVLAEARRVLRPGGRLSLFEPVLSEEELIMDWGEEEAAWKRHLLVLKLHHPAYGFGRRDLPAEAEEVGFEGVDCFLWHADITRAFEGKKEVMEDFATSLPGDLSLARVWEKHGVPREETERVAARIAAESLRPSFRNLLPCLYLWARKPQTR